MINAAIEIHKALGCGFLEIVIRTHFVSNWKVGVTITEREKQYPVYYKDILLPRSFCADFIVFDSVILEVKGKSGIASEDLAQTINYLKCSDCKVGLVLNLGKPTLEIRRVVF
ncbi:MAG: GxxExxY protein [Pedobacter agri]